MTGWIKNERMLVFTGIIAGIAAAAISYVYITNKEEAVINSMEPVEVVSAAEYIPALTGISSDMLKTIKIPVKYITEAHVRDYRKIADKVTLVPFIKGEPIMANKVAERGEELNTAIPTGLRAFTVGVDEESGVGYMLKPGDYVDVLLTFETVENKRKFTATATILQSERVIAVGTEFTVMDKSEPYSSVTLALTPEEAEILTFAKEKGRISFTLRAVGDKNKEKIKLASFTELINQIRNIEKGEEELKRNYIMERFGENDGIKRRVE